jgi:hypothetical protein
MKYKNENISYSEKGHGKIKGKFIRRWTLIVLITVI